MENHENEQKIINEENNKITPIQNSNDVIQINENEIKKNIIKNESNIIKKIFKFDNKKQQFLPIINKDNYEDIKNYFYNGLIQKYKNIEELKMSIKDKINFIQQLKIIIGNSYEVLHIIINYLNSNNIPLVEYFVDLFFKYVKELHSENQTKDNQYENLSNKEIIKEIKDAINWIICCGFLEKKNLDYIYQKVAELQLKNKLRNNIFYDYLDLLDIFYGKNYDKQFKEKLIAKNYLYFYDIEKSGIKTNIKDDKNNININDSCTIIMWFYLKDPIDETDNFESILCDIKLNEGHKFEFILSYKNDIIIRYNGETLLCEEKNKTFSISKNKWIQLKIQIIKSKNNKNKIKLNLFQGDFQSLKAQRSKKEDEENNIKDKIKYETKIYSLESISFEQTDLIVKSLGFFKNYKGLVGTIIFCDNNNPSEAPINSEYGLNSNNISEFLRESGLSKKYFIFSPSLFFNEKNKFVDSSNNIIGEIDKNKYNNKTMEFNNVFKYKNLFNKIYYLGGTINILPLFEIFYKFTKEIKNSETNNDEEILLYKIFKKLMKILELIFINKKKNYLEALYSNKTDNNLFFETLQLFLELIDEKYYIIDNEILNSLLNIGKSIYTFFDHKDTKKKEVYNYFKYILFYPKIIIKFTLSQQELLWKFFESIKVSDKSFSHSYYKKIFMSFDQLNAFLLLLSDKYKSKPKNVPLLPKSMINIIRNIFEDSSTTDKERENLLLLYNSKYLDNDILITIIEIFIFYLDTNKNMIVEKYSSNKTYLFKDFKDDDIIESMIKARIASINYFLNSSNNFIENLLNIFSTTNINLKKVVMNFIKILTQKYRENLETYFANIDTKIKKSKGKGKINRITKKEFYDFIQENIIPNNFNQILQENKIISKDEKNKREEDNKIRRKTVKVTQKIMFSNENDDENIKSNNENKIFEKEGENKINDNKKYRIIDKSKNNDDNDIKNLKFDNNIKNNLNKDKVKRSLSTKNKNISQLKITILNQNNYKLIKKNEIKETVSFEKIKELANHCVNYYLGNDTKNQCYLNQSNTKSSAINNISLDKNIKDSEYDKNENMIKEEKPSNKNNNNDILDEEENKSRLNENQKIKSELSMILFDWLLTIDSKNQNLSNKVQKSSNKNLNKINTSEVENIINILVKFLSNIKELEVIYKLLFVIMSHKSLGTINKISYSNEIDSNKNNNYFLLLNYFSFSETKFLQLIEELMINSYLCIHDENHRKIFILLSENSKIRSGLNNKDDFYNTIFSKSKELLLDIYFHVNNENKNKIIYNIINIILLECQELNIDKEKNKDDNKNKFNHLLTLLKDLLIEVFNIYSNKFSLEKFKNNYIEENNLVEVYNNSKAKEKASIDNKIKESFDSYFFSLVKYCIGLGPFVLEYCLLIRNCSKFVSESKIDIKIENFDYPEYLSQCNDLIVFIKFFNLVKKIIDISTLFLSSNARTKNFKNNVDENKEIYIFSEEDFSLLFKEYISNKDGRNKLKPFLELFLLKYNSSGYKNQLSFVEIFTIFYKFIIEEYLNSTKSKINIFRILNYYQDFIIYLIIISCLIKENDNSYYSSLNTNYKDIQDIFYVTLLFNINNIIKFMRSRISPCFIFMFKNILSLLSKIWELYEKEIKISSNKKYDKSCIKKIYFYYINKYTSFFNSSSLSLFAKNEKNINENSIIDHIDLLKSEIIEKKNEKYDKPLIEFLEFSKFETIYNIRKLELKNMKLLIKDENNNNNIFNEEEINNYRNILLKINSLKTQYEYDDINNSYNNIKKRKNYKKIKKYLYSWNNSYSNLNTFYNNMRSNNFEETKEEKDIYKLKYKISNFLCKDLTRKILIPVYDLDYYMPNFTRFDYKANLFEKKENKINDYELTYKIDLKIFEPIDIILPELEDNNYFICEACYIQTTHHIRGKIFISKSNELNDIYFSGYKKSSLSHEHLIKYEDYDSEHFSCFASIFKNNGNRKDLEIYLKINYSEINFIFLRKYCFRNNSFEIFTNKHKSYYFKFVDDKKRSLFVDNIIGKFNKEKKLFRPIKGLDQNNRTIIIGYYKDEDNNKEYSNISLIRDIWKSNKISTLEYLMWINIYGNRSFRDIAQYPVFPWLLNLYESDNFKDLVSNEDNIRDFRLPMGMISIDDRSKKRRESYLESYKSMVMDLIEENIIKLKMKEEDEDIDENIHKIPRRHSASLEEVSKDLILTKQSNEPLSAKKSDKNQRDSQRTESIIMFESIDDLIKVDKNEEELPKLLDYNYNIDKLYSNLDIQYDLIPYCFGSHFSNGMYVSHYLCRLFPYSLTMIEIQGAGFDCSERLFLNLQKSFYSSVTEKSDLREIIPEFFTMPELFININNLDFGQIEIQSEEITEKESENIKTKIKNNENVIIELDSKIKKKQVEDVELPTWCKDNPYSFVEKFRILFENNNLNINPWIDITFGYMQRGQKAQDIGNIFPPYVYDGVINSRLKSDELLKNREENEFKIRFFEMGVHPTKVFDRKCKGNKNKLINQLISSSALIEETEDILHEIKLKNNINNVIYFNTKIPNSEEIYIFDKSLKEQKIIIQENKESNNFIIKDSIINKELPINKKLEKNAEYKLIMKQIFKGSYFIITGLYDGELYILKNMNKNASKKEEKEKKDNENFNNLIFESFDKSLITSLDIDKEEKYLIYGTQKGSLVIYSLNFSSFKEGKRFINLIKFFSSHTGFSINYININSDLNLFIDCAYDGYAHIYTLPECNLIRSIYINSKISKDYFSLDFVFLSAQPLPSIILYSNRTYNFKCFSLNGNELKINNNNYDNDLIKEGKKDEDNFDDIGMSSPIIFTDSQFNDYLAYILNKKYVLIKKFPNMENIVMINPSPVKEELLTNLAISNDLRYLYIYEQINNKIYIIHRHNKIIPHINKANKDNKLGIKKSGQI